MTNVAQEAARLLARFGRRSAAVVRLATLPPICGIALFRAHDEHVVPVAVAVTAAAVWTTGYAWWLSRGRGHLPVALDSAVLLGLAGSVPWFGGVEDGNTGWLRLLVVFMCVTCQWHTPVLAGATAALAAGGGTVVAVGLAGVDADTVYGLLWAPAAAGLSRAVWMLVWRAAEQADLAAAEAARARTASLVAAAVRAEEREFASALHDTAATTLLMVGIGQVPADAGWLPAQAGRDLARLASGQAGGRSHADLVELLRARLDAVPLSVELDAPPSLRLPYGVAAAIADAAGESLTNARKHAGVDRAGVRLRGDEHALRVDVTDRGRGFAPDAVPATRYGLRESVHGRMERAGGTATITSAPGAGTLVRLEWRARAD
ncbi:hypothetical protein OIE66_24030 [Nonomuraea sp. NBC_01738]|uniref:sensor histidine kinase n=1 Tax=Nonomuraea sp. NBC_01738 TaxID=2976003 RepID=UPI002E11D1F0|nr:hypothetical protein OIE66_24030 [Nonomuraea sp. NBC_01738]